MAHPAENLLFFMCRNSLLSLQNASKKKLDGLIEWVGPLQNEHYKTYNFAF
jgi:hypothetical protein